MMFDKRTAVLQATEENNGEVTAASKGVHLLFGYT